MDNGITELITKWIENNVNPLCSCRFTVYSPSIFCFDNVSLTLRGSAETTLVTYLQHWVSSGNSTVTIQGVALHVDKSCKVVIQSLDDAGCQYIIEEPQKLTSEVGIIVGAIIGFTVATGIILFLIVALWSYRRMKKISFK